MSRTIKAHKEAAIHEAITTRESQMTYDNEAIVRNAYHTATTHWSLPELRGWIWRAKNENQEKTLFHTE